MERIEIEEEELLRQFRELIPTNRANALSNIRIAYVVQENTKRQYGLLPESGQVQMKQAGTGA